jgi:mycothiol synthase
MEVRRMEKKDIQAYTDLYNLAEAHDPEFVRRTIQDMEKIIFRKSTDSLDGYFVACESGRMVAGGSGRFSPDQANDGRGSFTLYVMPNHLGSGAEQEVYDEITGHMKKVGAKSMGTRANTTNVSKVRVLERLGFIKTAYQRHHMERSPHGVSEPVLPDGYKLRNARMPSEMEQLLETINAAYSTREGFGVQTLEEISKFPYLTDPEFLPGLFVVERIEDGKIVGMLGSQIEHVYNREHGRKRGSSYSLMVIPSERGKGIGRALMQSSLHWIGSKGMDVAYLGVNHQNPDALHLYKSLGYELVGIWQGYEREL